MLDMRTAYGSNPEHANRNGFNGWQKPAGAILPRPEGRGLPRIVIRVVPPSGHSAAFCQTGEVVEVTDESITLYVLVDVVRRMAFDRTTGLDRGGQGSFLVRSDWMA